MTPRLSSLFLAAALLLNASTASAQKPAARPAPRPAPTAQAPQAVGSFGALEGGVTVERKAVVQPAVVGGELFEGDRIRTSADGRADITLSDGSRLTLTALGNLVVSRYLISAKQDKREAGFDLISGRLKAYVSKLAASIEQNVWQVKTPTAVAGVRGTEFFVLVDDGDDGGEAGTEVIVEEGEVEVSSSDAGIEGIARLVPGQFSRVLAGQGPASPQSAAALIDRIRRRFATAGERESQSRREAVAGVDPNGGDAGDGDAPAPGDPFGDLGGDLPPFQQVPTTLPGGDGGLGPLPVDPLPAVLDIGVRVNDRTAP